MYRPAVLGATDGQIARNRQQPHVPTVPASVLRRVPSVGGGRLVPGPVPVQVVQSLRLPGGSDRDALRMWLRVDRVPRNVGPGRGGEVRPTEAVRRLHYRVLGRVFLEAVAHIQRPDRRARTRRHRDVAAVLVVRGVVHSRTHRVERLPEGVDRSDVLEGDVLERRARGARRNRRERIRRVARPRSCVAVHARDTVPVRVGAGRRDPVEGELQQTAGEVRKVVLQRASRYRHRLAHLPHRHDTVAVRELHVHLHLHMDARARSGERIAGDHLLQFHGVRVDRLGHLPAALRQARASRQPPGGLHRLRAGRLLCVHLRDEPAQHQPPSGVRRVPANRSRRRDLLSGDEQHSESRCARKGTARRHELVPRAVESHRMHRVDDAAQQLVSSRQPSHLCRVYRPDSHRITRRAQVHLNREG